MRSAPPEKSMQLQGRGHAEISVGFNQSVSAAAPHSAPPAAARLHQLATDCTNPPFKRPPPARALLEVLLCGQIRAAAHTCLVRPNADLFLLANSCRNQWPLQKHEVDSGSLSTRLSAQSGTVTTLLLHCNYSFKKNKIFRQHERFSPSFYLKWLFADVPRGGARRSHPEKTTGPETK